MIAGWILFAVAIFVEAKSHDHVVGLLLLILAVLCAIGDHVSDIRRDLRRLAGDRTSGTESHRCTLHPRR